jgi:hypothetical protein
VFNCTPEALAPAVREGLVTFLHTAEGMQEGFIRPGCTHLTVDLTMVRRRRRRRRRPPLRQLSPRLTPGPPPKPAPLQSAARAAAIVARGPAPLAAAFLSAAARQGMPPEQYDEAVVSRPAARGRSAGTLRLAALTRGPVPHERSPPNAEP